MQRAFSVARFLAILIKEFIQMRRDRVTFAMMVGVPVVQLLLFGFAINSDPRHLPTLVEIADEGPLARSLLSGMANSGYFDFRGTVTSSAEGDTALRNGEANFIVTIPAGFERDIVRSRRPAILISADASDPTAIGGAASALGGIVNVAIGDALTGPLNTGASGSLPFSIDIHRQYNPEGKTSTNIVPGLLAVILSMSTIMVTAVAIVREVEKGTMETLIATPARPAEVMLGKILPYVLVGYVQTIVFLIAARLVFDVPFEGDPLAFFAGFNLFVLLNLAIGFLISTAARNQMQAMQLSFFSILPTILLSGFMFPFAGMPAWAQFIGTAVPATHFLRIVRKVMLKGASFPDISGEMFALTIIMIVITVVAMRRYRQTLD